VPGSPSFKKRQERTRQEKQAEKEQRLAERKQQEDKSNPVARDVQYVLSIHAERFHRTLRYHWTICAADSPDRIVSWGHAASHELAETAAQNEIRDLSSGLTQGGRAL